jgi:hypothetical protein
MNISKGLKALGLAALMSTALAQTAMAEPTDRGITVALAVELDSLDACDTQPAQNANIAPGRRYARTAARAVLGADRRPHLGVQAPPGCEVP